VEEGELELGGAGGGAGAEEEVRYELTEL